MDTTRKTVFALFDRNAAAESAVRDLQQLGITRDDISIVAHEYQDEHATDDQFSGADKGAAGGGVIGGALGLLVGLGALAIPGIGPLLAAGPLAAALMGAGLGATGGGVIGTLISTGAEERDAQVYAEGVRRGGTLLSVAAQPDHTAAINEIFVRHGAVDINDRRTTLGAEGWSGFDAQGSAYTPTIRESTINDTERPLR